MMAHWDFSLIEYHLVYYEKNVKFKLGYGEVT